MGSKTSIILCTYNEANHIKKTISELEKNISNLELVIIDDFSSDGTTEIIRELNQNNKYKVVYRKKSRSLASAFVRGVIETTGERIGWIDTNQGDLASKFPKMIEELNSDNDIVVLSRYVKGGDDQSPPFFVYMVATDFLRGWWPRELSKLGDRYENNVSKGNSCIQ